MSYLLVFLKEGCIPFALQGSRRNAGLEIVPNKDVSRRTEKVMFVWIVWGEARVHTPPPKLCVGSLLPASRLGKQQNNRKMAQSPALGLQAPNALPTAHTAALAYHYTFWIANKTPGCQLQDIFPLPHALQPLPVWLLIGVWEY